MMLSFPVPGPYRLEAMDIIITDDKMNAHNASFLISDTLLSILPAIYYALVVSIQWELIILIFEDNKNWQCTIAVPDRIQ